jgi:hypothetical protein
MRRWFLSYTSQDFALTQALKGALQRREPDAHIFFAPESMRAGGLWQHQLAEEIAASTAFVLLIGEIGIGQWQVMEYYEALDRRVKEANYPIILILSAKRAAPGLPFARQLHWVVTEDPASEATVGKLIDAASGPATRPGELWRYTRPYRGLEAMTEVNSDFFLGRERETIEEIDALIATKSKLPVLLGNSGVGKSSLARRGVFRAGKHGQDGLALAVDADRGCVAARSYGSAGCARGTRWGARTRPYRRNRCRLRDRLEGALPHQGCRIRLRRSQYPPNQNHPGIPDASTRTRRARLKFQIFLGSLCPQSQGSDPVGREGRAQGRLCSALVTANGGKKELVGLTDGVRESTRSWKELLLDLKRRDQRVHGGVGHDHAGRAFR